MTLRNISIPAGMPKRNEQVVYSEIASVLDFQVFQINWLWDMNTRAAVEILKGLGYLDRITALLPDTERCRNVISRYQQFMRQYGDDDHLGWSEISREKIQDCRIFSLHSSEREAADGRRSTAYMIEASDWVTVIPLLKKEDGDYFVMVRQYRHGSMEITTEFPAGTLEPGEEAETAAVRELEEETGYRAGRLTWLGSVNPNPAFLTNTSSTFLAEDLVATGVQNLDENEYVDYQLVSVEEVIKKMGSGEYSNGTMLMALMYYLRESGRIKSPQE